MRSERPQLDDQWLDAALRRYGSVEPRAGLELRVLTVLREREAQPARSRLWWSVVLATGTAVAAALVIIASLGPPPAAPRPRIAGTPVIAKTSTKRNVAGREHPHIVHRFANTNPAGRASDGTSVEPSAARREQFPSPSPLSEQEQLLARYVREHYQQAVLVARAQVELLKQDRLEDARADEQRFGKTPEQVK